MRKIVAIVTVILTLQVFIVPTVFGETDSPSPPELKSEAAIVMDSKSGEVLYAKNAEKEMYPASLTKIATAIYTIEHVDLDEVATVSSNARHTEGTRVYLKEGERATLKKLLQGLLINSGNDAGVAIAEHISGSVEEFAEKLNDYLKTEIGVSDTHFENPHGLFNPNHVTTAEDLAKITKYAMNNEVFRTIFGTKKLKWDGAAWDTTLYSHHKLTRQKLYDKVVTGGKTGFVNQSGFTLATTAKKDNISLIIITLNSKFQRGAYNDTIKLLNYGFENFQTSSISEGTAYHVDGKEYIAPKKLYYTHFKTKQVVEKVKAGGVLEITDQAGKVLSSFQLKDPDSSVEKDASAQSAHHTGTGFPIQSHLPNLFVSIGLSIVDLFNKYI
ncbi:D-alanyl-D-alanine carboxypeptidase family protein [Halobacillus naozhouensis]|uniref:D-alanyl-D-alanine carboxypeptidase n=1 Tax=Halobacillus naozhouensis TaxID=554880 RepID=A0ABY8IYP5_9BACI|nr:D-alanyl-D-alanine carboxypeptidase family protein [Halobacillus naozhouensis]WFT73761.1 D-alanyl-D-alanine carboxypeptidase [Halobacillus naozhouensis]